MLRVYAKEVELKTYFVSCFARFADLLRSIRKAENINNFTPTVVIRLTSLNVEFKL